MATSLVEINFVKLNLKKNQKYRNVKNERNQRRVGKTQKLFCKLKNLT
jgi:hypothetical protein